MTKQTEAAQRKLDRVLSPAETAAVLGINERTLRRLVQDGEGPERVQLSKRRYGHRESAVDRWLANRVCTISRVAAHV
jgi:predicted DNA-binding transcriptional regulator AlpA